MVLQSAMAGSVALGKLDLCSVRCIDSNGGDIQSCKLCSNSEYVSKMLLCDRCEEAFHVSCCKPRVVLPVDDWFCHSCSELIGKMSHNTSFLKSPSIGAGIGSCRFVLGPIAVMLKYPEPYTSKVRMGEAYQAQVPDWCHQNSLTQLSEVRTDDLVCSSAVISNWTDSDSADPQMGSGTTGLASTSRKRKQELLS